MANSGSITTSGYGSQGRALQFNWNLASQSVSGNYSIINWEIRGVGGTTTSWYKCGPVYGNINGGQCCARGDRFELYNGTVVASGQWTIGHNNDGSKSFSADISGAIYSASVNVSGSGSWSLPAIPRQANITNSPASFNDESNPWFSYSNPANASLKCWLEPNPNGDHLCERTLSGTSGTYTWSLTETERNQLRARCSGNSCTVRIGLYSTIGGTTYASYHDRIMTIVNGSPTFTNFTYKDTNSKVVAVTGNNQILVKGLSTLQAIISSSNKMVANKQATAKNYVSTIDTANISSNYTTEDLTVNIGAIKSIGTQRLNIRAYDSRNNSTLAYKDITVYDYDKPVINASVTRLNNFENQTTLKVSGTYSKLVINNVSKNIVKTLQYRYREAGGTWTGWKTLTSTIKDGKFTCNDVILSLDNTKSFDFEIQTIDNLETTTLSLNLDIGQAIFFISSNKKACYINGQEILTYDVVDTW